MLSHRPNVWMRESWTPLSVAVAAAPMRKLCPAYRVASTLAAVRAVLTTETNRSLVRAQPSPNWKKGPLSFPRLTMLPLGRAVQLFAEKWILLCGKGQFLIPLYAPAGTVVSCGRLPQHQHMIGDMPGRIPHPMGPPLPLHTGSRKTHCGCSP